MSLCMSMIIALVLAFLVVVSTHLFVMDSVDKFNGYGERSTTCRDWADFERRANSIDI